MVISSGNQRPSAAIRGHQRPSETISGNQRPSAAIRGHQRPSAVFRGHPRSHEITCSSDIRRRARAIAILFERFGSISCTVSFFALVGVAAALASSLVSERPRVSPDEGGNPGPDEGGNQGLVSERPRVSPSPNVGAIRDLMKGAIRATCLTQPKRRLELLGIQGRLCFVNHVLLEPDCVGDLQRCAALMSGNEWQ